MLVIDTHSHIYTDEFSQDRSQVVERAFAAGVEKIFLPNINAGTIEPMMNLCAAYPSHLYPMIGLHPTDITPDYKEVLNQMQTMLESPHPFIAIGEVGLDYYWDKTYYEEQKEVFDRQIGWAESYHLPLMIHTREAHTELLEMMDRHRNKHLSGVFHSFSGTIEEASQLLDFPDFYLGINGIVTFKKSSLPEVLKEIPLERIVLETDSPYLAPVPHRGKRNESAYVINTLYRLSEIYNCTPDEVAQVTAANALKVFPKAKTD